VVIRTLMSEAAFQRVERGEAFLRRSGAAYRRHQHQGDHADAADPQQDGDDMDR
jgi:hypothetical protein